MAATGNQSGLAAGPDGLQRRLFRVLGWGLLLSCLIAGLVWGYFHHMAHYMNRDNCANNLHQIAQAISLYADAHGGHYPDSLRTILLRGEVSPAVFVCPVTGDTAATGPTMQIVAEKLTDGRHLSYIYVGRELMTGTAGVNTVVVYEPLLNHGDGMNVLFGDGHSEFVDIAKGKKIEADSDAACLPVTLR